MGEKLYALITVVVSWILSFIFLTRGFVGATVIIMMVPAVVAVIITIIKNKSFISIFRPITRKVNLKAVLFALIYPLVIIALCGILALVTGLGKKNTDIMSLLIKVLSYIVASVPFMIVTLGEEYGWRGYYLPELSKKYGLKKANLIVGLTWMAFHLPAFYIINLNSGVGKAAIFTIIQLGSVFFLNYSFTYLYSLSQNVLLAAIMHSVWNNINTLLLGDAYRNTSKALILGNVNIINGERLFGLIFLAISVVVLTRKFDKKKVV